ncbi:MAG: hypothetical protein ABI760_23320 [Ferruginibacter sp.]
MKIVVTAVKLLLRVNQWDSPAMNILLMKNCRGTTSATAKRGTGFSKMLMLLVIGGSRNFLFFLYIAFLAISARQTAKCNHVKTQ